MLIGIDLGTTNSLVGAIDSGLPVLFADPDGFRMTPSVVAFPPDGNPLVGRAALAHPGDAIRSVKRLMGENSLIPAGGKSWKPEEVSALILRKLVDDAARATGTMPDRAVITVPAYFNDSQRQATKRAAELAGLQVERLLPEPTAAALAFGLDRKAGRFAVYDLGGGTFDLTILELQDGVFHVLSTHGDTRLGGDDLDDAIAREFHISRDDAESLKRTATGSDLARIEKVCGPVIERTRRLCERALLDAGITASQLDEVILVGGATRMPLVRSFVAELFGREPDTSQHPDEAVAIGAVLQAGILEGTLHGVTLLDVTPLSLGIETYGGLMNVIIPRNTTIPAKAGEMFTNAAANQTSMRITVLQGEREMAADNWKLGECVVPFPPAPRGQARVGVQFELDANGILHVLARDTATGTDTMLEISSAVDVSDEAVEKMLGDAIEHAFEDMDDRQFAEALLKAEEMLPAVEDALRTSTPPDDELAAIRSAEADVRSAIDARSLRRLKSALDALDKATAPLAARILESAIAAGASGPRHAEA